MFTAVLGTGTALEQRDNDVSVDFWAMFEDHGACSAGSEAACIVMMTLTLCGLRRLGCLLSSP